MRMLSLLLIFNLVAPAVIVDRVAITVGNKVITQSEIELRIRLTAFQNGEKPDFSLASRRQAAKRLIDQKLVDREMEVGRYPRLDEEQRDGLLAEYAKTNYKSDAAALGAALAALALMPEDLAGDLARQSELLTFLSLRFRPAVQVTDQDVQKYFTEKIKAGDLNEMRAQIEEQLTIERADKELDAWLQNQRKTTRIEYALKDLEENKE